jgi:hypothetical protein
MDDEITSGAMQKLIGVNRVALNDLAKRGIVKRGERKGTYAVEASVTAFCQHLRSMAASRGGEAGADVRARLGAAQADLAAEKVKAMRGEVLPTAEVEALWRGKLRVKGPIPFTRSNISKSRRIGAIFCATLNSSSIFIQSRDVISILASRLWPK